VLMWCEIVVVNNVALERLLIFGRKLKELALYQ
jgi:hypothetical protein